LKFFIGFHVAASPVFRPISYGTSMLMLLPPSASFVELPVWWRNTRSFDEALQRVIDEIRGSFDLILANFGA
jgi:hypothetical protein